MYMYPFTITLLFAYLTHLNSKRIVVRLCATNDSCILAVIYAQISFLFIFGSLQWIMQVICENLSLDKSNA